MVEQKVKYDGLDPIEPIGKISGPNYHVNVSGWTTLLMFKRIIQFGQTLSSRLSIFESSRCQLFLQVVKPDTHGVPKESWAIFHASDRQIDHQGGSI